ncbi:hypothetical protein VNO77_15972 [Canavalia gladiata]|uniref:Uncharacterized protein n=1 Tax=Canavalia gladiata TaxID=3824 RepID=A0AAN9M3B1_CANGL
MRTIEGWLSAHPEIQERECINSKTREWKTNLKESETKDSLGLSMRYSPRPRDDSSPFQQGSKKLNGGFFLFWRTFLERAENAFSGLSAVGFDVNLLRF